MPLPSLLWHRTNRILLLPAYAVDEVTYVLRAKASCTAVGVGIDACGDPHRMGNLPSWVVETGTPMFDTVAKLELQVGACDLGFGSRVI